MKIEPQTKLLMPLGPGGCSLMYELLIHGFSKAERRDIDAALKWKTPHISIPITPAQLRQCADIMESGEKNWAGAPLKRGKK